MKYAQFIFERYVFDRDAKSLELHYAVDDAFTFVEKYNFDFEIADYDPKVLDRAVQNLFFMAGVSYYRLFLPPEIIVKQGEIDKSFASFLNHTYQKGLGEFFYVNQLDPRTSVSFPVNASPFATLDHDGSGMLVGLGGGKDSLVTLELLKDGADITTWNSGHNPQLITGIIEKSEVPHVYVRKFVDPKLFEMIKRGEAMGGHIPFSAVIACLGTVVAILTGRQDVVVSNEQSANEETLQYKGVSINHQYSKTQEFERDYQALLKHCFGSSLRYYSFLRPLSELRIADIFATVAFDKYKDVFTSCNRAFRFGSQGLFWCGECPKCAFIFLALTPFVERQKLESLWEGQNLLLDPAHDDTYRGLLGIEGDKPLECVGEVKESRAAMRLAQGIYPELRDKYHFDLPADYDYKALASHEMPPEVYDIFKRAMKRF